MVFDFEKLKDQSIVTILFATVFLSGCISSESYIQKRRQQLLDLYPPGITSRSDVQARWRNIQPQFSEVRPSTGWADCRYPDSTVGQRCLAVEHRTGKEIQRCERYFGPDGLFSLCYCWFYYDSADRLVDAEWQWSTD